MIPSNIPDAVPAKRLPKRAAKGRLFLAGSLVLAGTLALFYAEENWRGERAWKQFRAAAEASGKSLDWRLLIPPKIPDDQNMFAVPGMKVFIKEPGDRKLVKSVKIQPPGPSTPPPAAPDPSVIKTDELLVATIATMPPGRPDAGCVEVKSAAEAASEIAARTRLHASGAQGITLVAGSLAAAEPCRILFRDAGPSLEKEMGNLLNQFVVRRSRDGTLLVLLRDVRTVEKYLASTPSVEGDWAFLSQALQRPQARIPGDYTVPALIPMPNFIKVRTTAQTLAQQAQSYLLLGQPAEAVKRLRLLNGLGVLAQGPSPRSATLVGAMIKTALSGLYVAVVQDGFRLGAWGDAELQEIAKQTGELDLFSPMLGALNNELVATTFSLPQYGFSELFELDEGIKLKIYDYMPRGWLYQNMATYGRLMTRQISAIEGALPLVDAKTISRASDEFLEEVERSSPFALLARIGIPNTRKVAQTVTRNSTIFRLATIACSLERYRLAHHAYPAQLQELVPDFLPQVPREIIGGRAFHYKLSLAGAFLLYSEGWNERDDHGQTSPKSEEGDWVWSATPT